MLPIINNVKQPAIQEGENPVARRQPILVYNARVDSILEEIVIQSKTVTVTTMSADWMLFMDNLNSEMFNKISF